VEDMENLILQLKQQPDFQEKPVLAFECTWDKLLHEINDLLSQLGFSSFTYSVLTRGRINSGAELLRKRWEEGADLVGSLPDGAVREYYRDIAKDDPLWGALPEITSPLLVSSLPESPGGNVDAFWHKNDVASRVYIPMKSKSDGYWFHYFGLFHQLPPEQFEVYFNKISEWFLPILTRYHDLLQAVCEKEQNPYLKDELLSSTCRQILEMTAQGMAVKRIADKLALTEEGITYHITRAKRVFNAKNKTQLVAIMHEVGFL
jgi:DNA-binding CsgD family transcriptional regulator